MAYLMRSLALIGAIAFNSPVHGDKTGDKADATLQAAVHAIGQIDTKKALSGVAAAREAAEILAGLDPETRSRVLALTLGAGAARPEAGLLRTAAPPSR